MQILRRTNTESDQRPDGRRRRFAGGGKWWQLTAIVISGVAFAGRAIAAADSPGRPNILVILADDLGYGDVQCYNPQRGKIPTPNIDRLAAQGMRFTDGHSASGVCSPSRYALLTGRYPWRTRLQKGIVNVFGEPLIAPGRLKTPPGPDPPDNPVSYQPPPQNRILAVTERNWTNVAPQRLTNVVS